ncbi:lysophospholipid acyltransferase family protein [Geotoga petraea]|jgi:1-acyl-sn-glycerol-3-phosphate acyltransferase|uniref:1-acyl-sn-glycerol-3-phosphate acyltransferase n=1 Tax=Geotoga petraea TaxID=28234 RepID=A0A4Z0W366_9BACT|nr:lysophospholipid acyltransferase family protein [Geotoga petraea]TGG88959.1 1-acyl-sn-glycerol-3-phosphate acyltransferase [Geotoga petraea]
MNKKHTAPADTLLWRTAHKLLYPLFDNFLDIKVQKKKEIPEPPFILIANHTHFLDGFFLSYAINKPISWVVAKGNFENKLLSLALKGIGSIPKQKNKPDIVSIRNIYRTFQKNGIVGMFPEGSVAWDGSFGKVPKGTDKFIDRMKVPVVAAQVYGGYLSKPRWAEKSRRGTIEIKLDVFEGKEALDFINVSEWDWQKEKMKTYKGKNKTKGLKRLMWYCPECKSFHSFKYLKKSMKCQKCGFEVFVDEYGFINKKTAKDILDEQKKIMKIDYDRNKKYYFGKSELVRFTENEKTKYKGVLQLHKGILSIDNFEIKLKDIKNDSTFLKKINEFFYEGDLYRLKTENSSLFLKNLTHLLKEE